MITYALFVCLCVCVFFFLMIRRPPRSTLFPYDALPISDGADQVQVLLSEMTLKDRSLESIFNSAGQDVIEKLAGGDVKEDGSSEGDGAAADDNTEESPEDAEE